MIDINEIMLEDKLSVLEQSMTARTHAYNGNSRFLGNLYHSAIDRFYNHSDKQYDIIYQMLKLIQNQRKSHSAIEKFKYASGSNFDELKDFYLQFLSKDLYGRVSSDIGIIDNDSLINENMEKDIVNKINQAMFELPTLPQF